MSGPIIAILGAFSGIGAALVLASVTGREVFPRPSSGNAQDRASFVNARALTAAGAGLTAIVLTGWPVAAVLAIAAVLAVPTLIGGKAGRDAAIARTEAIATWTEMVRDSIAAASGLEEAIAGTAAVAPAAIRREVRLLVTRLERRSLADSLAAFGSDLAHPSADLVVAALTIAARTEASDLASLLSRLAEAIRGEARMRIRVEVGRTRVRTATKVILGVVGATVGLLAVLNRGYLAVYADPAGQVVLLIVGGVFAFGGWLLVRMAALELPERFSARPAGGDR